MTKHETSKITIALTWCLAWGNQREPQYSLDTLRQMREALKTNHQVPTDIQRLLKQVQDLQILPETPEKLTDLKTEFPDLWNQSTRIGLVYGGVTKVKQYVFESAKLPEIRGASAMLDKINLVDLPAFFNKLPEDYETLSENKTKQSLVENLQDTRNWLDENFPDLAQALIPELIIYSTGGNILAFCPAAYVDDLANAIEKRYTQETITANSCAVGKTFRLLEIRYGLLAEDIEQTRWFEWHKGHDDNPLVKEYFGIPEKGKLTQEQFFNRKSFNELAGKLAAEFQKRRNGNQTENRSSRCYPPMLETHPYLMRDESDRTSAICQMEHLPDQPYYSETLARKRLVGQIAKNDESGNWYPFEWYPAKGTVRGWVTKFRDYLKEEKLEESYYGDLNQDLPEEAQSLPEIGNRSNGYVAFIYADGNNMGGYIQKIKSPEEYQQFSQDIFEATEKSVYIALEKYLKPHQLKNSPKDKESRNKNGDWIYPFEIITIGGDDVLLIVPADKALEVAHTISVEFERMLLKRNSEKYQTEYKAESIKCHRYKKEEAQPLQCKISMSIGVLITSSNTPIYYAENLTNQLLKSAKKQAKDLKKTHRYCSGTIDFMVLKSVTMISSNIESFRKQGLTKEVNDTYSLKLYAAPYTLHEIAGLLETIRALKKADFPRSQLYQIRNFLEVGKKTAMLNYRYFRVRLKKDKQNPLIDNFEQAWCQAKENEGNLAPWIYTQNPEKVKYYETIWREIVDLYDFIEEQEEQADTLNTSELIESK